MPGSTYRVVDPMQPRKKVDPIIRAVATDIQSALESSEPRRSGTLAGAWTLQKGRVPAVWLVVNTTPYGRYVEYGTRHMRAQPVLGRVLTAFRARLSR